MVFLGAYSLSQNLLDKEDKSENIFSYYPLNARFEKTKQMAEKGKYAAMILPKNKNFISLIYTGVLNKTDPEGNDLFILGLKFHISLPEPDNERFELSRGWDIVSAILMTNQVNSKIIRQNVQMSDIADQRGKVITVLATPEKSSHMWQAIFQEITQKLTEANIPPGYRPPGTNAKPERILNGSNYVTYRYFDEDGRIPRLRGREKTRIQNLFDNDNQFKGELDPIKKIKITVENQLDIPEWDANELQSSTPNLR